MKRIVLSDASVDLTLGAIGGLIVGFTHASPGTTYPIAFGLVAIGIAIMFGPDRVRLWREVHGRSSKRHHAAR